MLLDITQLATLFVAGILGGILNSIAGGEVLLLSLPYFLLVSPQLLPMPPTHSLHVLVI